MAGAVAAALGGMLAAADQNDAATREVLALERTTLDGWQTGIPIRCSRFQTRDHLLPCGDGQAPGWPAGPKSAL